MLHMDSFMICINLTQKYLVTRKTFITEIQTDMKIRRISLSKLEKAGMVLIMNNIILILKEYDTEKLHLDFMLKILEKNQLQVNTISPLRGPLRFTADVQHWHDERVRLAGSIVIQMRGIAQGNLESMRENIKITQEIVQDYLTGLRKKKKEDVEAMLDSFLRIVKKDKHISDAFTNIALMPYIEELELASKKHNKFYKERISEAAKKQKGDKNKAIKKEAQAALRSLFEQIEMGHRNYPELNYMPLMTRLNVDLARFTNSIKTRDTYNKKRAKKAKEEKEAALPSKLDSDMNLELPASEEENQD